MACYEYHLGCKLKYRKDLIYSKIKFSIRLAFFYIQISFYVFTVASFEHIVLQDDEEVGRTGTVDIIQLQYCYLSHRTSIRETNALLLCCRAAVSTEETIHYL
jgi:hypothetical protein